MDWTTTRRSSHVGYVVQAIVNNLAPLLFVVFSSRYGIGLAQLGALASLNFGVQLATDLVAAAVVDRVGYRIPMVAAHVLSAAGLVALGVLPLLAAHTFAALCAAVVVYAVGGGLLEVVVSPVVEHIPDDSRPKAAGMALLHSFYCWGQLGVVLVTTGALAAVGEQWWPALPVAWACVPVANGIVLARAPMPETVPGAHRTPLRELGRSGAFLLALALMATGGAAELTMSQWSSFFAQQGAGVAKQVGDVFGPGLFALLMGAARAWHATAGARFDLRRLLMASGTGACACYLLAALAPWAWLSLLGCAGTGLFVALMWPGTFSLTAARFPAGGAAMFALLALGGDLGAAVGPSAASLVASASSALGAPAALLSLPGGGLRTGLLVCALVPALFVMGVARWEDRAARPDVPGARRGPR